MSQICRIAALLWALFLPIHLHAEPLVDVELVIAADVSLSMDRGEKRLQQAGFVQAFRDPAVINAIRNGPLGRIAVTYLEWGGENRFRVVIPWMTIDGRGDAERFAKQLAANRPARFRKGTSISGALMKSHQLLRHRGSSAARRVINISGDGVDSSVDDLAYARGLIVADGVTINGLPIVYKGLLEGVIPGTAREEADPRMLVAYFEQKVIGGPNAFVEPVVAPEDYSDAIRRKLIREIGSPHYASLKD